VLALVCGWGAAGCSPCPPGESRGGKGIGFCSPDSPLRGDELKSACDDACEGCNTLASTDQVCLDTCQYRAREHEGPCQLCLFEWFRGFCVIDDERPTVEDACGDECAD
jgi:hypothetical protein